MNQLQPQCELAERTYAGDAPDGRDLPGVSTNVGRFTGVKFDEPASDNLAGIAEAAIVVSISLLPKAVQSPSRRQVHHLTRLIMKRPIG